MAARGPRGLGGHMNWWEYRRPPRAHAPFSYGSPPRYTSPFTYSPQHAEGGGAPQQRVGMFTWRPWKRAMLGPVTTTLGIGLAAGGGVGYAKKGSKVSLMAGAATGSIFIAASAILRTAPSWSVRIGLVTSLGIGAHFFEQARKKPENRFASSMAVVALAAALFYSASFF